MNWFLLIGSLISTTMAIYYIIEDVKFCFDLQGLNTKIGNALLLDIVKSFGLNLVWLGMSIFCLFLNF